jgi:hypothetical protein
VLYKSLPSVKPTRPPLKLYCYGNSITMYAEDCLPIANIETAVTGKWTVLHRRSCFTTKLAGVILHTSAVPTCLQRGCLGLLSSVLLYIPFGSTMWLLTSYTEPPISHQVLHNCSFLTFVYPRSLPIERFAHDSGRAEYGYPMG